MPGTRHLLIGIAVVLVTAGCRDSAPRRGAGVSASSSTTTQAAPATTTTPGPATTTPGSATISGSPTTSGTMAPAAATPTTSTAAAGPAPVAGAVSAVTAADLPSSWRPGCPLSPDRLRRVLLGYWGFDNQPHVGVMVVNAAVTDDVVKIFSTLYREHFPIHQMQPVDAYGGSDPASMAADNTSGFNCRYAVAPGPPQWSAHAFGEAIDVNAIENPYIEGGTVTPPAGVAFVDRSVVRTGMAVPAGPLVRAFAAAGWSWGGRWSQSPDYQHFSKTGG